MKELDDKDLRLLDLLQEGSRNTVGRIAKALALHKNSVTYRISRLQRLGVIKRFSFIPGIKALEKNTFYVLLRLRFDDKDQDRIQESLKGHPLAISVLRLSGRWNFMMELVCGDINEFNDELTKIIDQLGGSVSDYSTVFLYLPYKVENSICFHKASQPLAQFKPPETKAEIDLIDRRILGRLADDSNLHHNQIAEIAGEANITADTSFYRTKKLLKQKVILKFVPIIDLEKMGYQRYMILLKFSDMGVKRFDELRRHLLEDKNTYLAFRTAGDLGVVFFCAYKTNSELDVALMRLNQLFGPQIRQQELFIINEVLSLEYFPKGLRQ